VSCKSSIPLSLVPSRDLGAFPRPHLGDWQPLSPEDLDPDTSGLVLQISADEYPALASLVRYSGDVEGYLKSLGLSEEAVADETAELEHEHTMGTDA
jgi:hypothetical protein